MRSSTRAKFAWLVFFACLVGACGAFAYLVAYPVYKQPTTHLWNTWAGYPAMLRRFNRPIPVPTELVEQRRLVNDVSAVGTMQYLDTVPVDTEVVGIVVDVPVIVGQRVRAGDTLLSVSTGGQEARQAQFDLESKTAAFNKAKADYNRDTEALKKGLIAQANYDQTYAAYLEAKSNLEKSQDTLDTTILTRSSKVARAAAIDPPESGQSVLAAVKQPLGALPPDLGKDMNGPGEKLPVIALTDGTIAQVNTYPGQNLTQPTNKLITIGDQLIFAASVDQRYFSQIQIGDRAAIYLRALAGQPLEGQIVRIDPTVAGASSGSGSGGSGPIPFTFTASLRIEAKPPPLAPGMNGYCVFSRSEETLAVDDSALMRYSGGQGVVAVVDSNNRVHFVAVSYAFSADGWVAIKSGLSNGERVITQGQTGLREGDRVVVQ